MDLELVLSILTPRIVEFGVGKVKACSIVKMTCIQRKRDLYSGRIFITKSILYKEINTRAVYILQLPMLQELSTSMTSYKPIERSAWSADQEDCVS